MEHLFSEIVKAKGILCEIACHTPLLQNHNLSNQFKSAIFFKREDCRVVRSYKIRGAFNKVSSLDAKQISRGVICASAGNHTQGVAYSCDLLGIQAKIFMLLTTPSQKIKQIKLYGKDKVEIMLYGNTYDECYKQAKKESIENVIPLYTSFR